MPARVDARRSTGRPDAPSKSGPDLLCTTSPRKYAASSRLTLSMASMTENRGSLPEKHCRIAAGEIEVDQQRRPRLPDRQRRGDVDGDGRGADAAFRADEGEHFAALARRRVADRAALPRPGAPEATAVRRRTPLLRRASPRASAPARGAEARAALRSSDAAA